jgi:hypothetical protein
MIFWSRCVLIWFKNMKKMLLQMRSSFLQLKSTIYESAPPGEHDFYYRRGRCYLYYNILKRVMLIVFFNVLMFITEILCFVYE